MEGDVMSETTQQDLRIAQGIQCPECYGIDIELRKDKFGYRIAGFLCVDCGCQWTPPISPP